MPRPKYQPNQQPGYKSAAIRELLTQNRKTSVKDIVSTLAGRGIDVTPNLVHIIKSKMKARRQRAKREQVVATGQEAGITNPIELVRRVKALADATGGLGKLKQLVDIMAV